jgi:hypothetical protein
MTKKKAFKVLKITYISLLIAMVVVSLFFGRNFFGGQNNSALASNTLTWGDGEVSINKVYFEDSLEKSTIQVGVDSVVTVRLKYANTSTATNFANSYILDSLPSNFDLVAGSLKNCYNSNPCVSLNNNLFNASDLRVAPAAGYLGNATDNTLLQSDLVADTDGYIEYQMEVQDAAKGQTVGTIVSFISSGNTITDSAEFSIAVSGLICSYLNPDPSQRSISLGDVELRTDQDFTCNFVPRICPAVFLDLNANGIINGAEVLEDGVVVELYDQTELNLIDSLTTTDILNQTCFEELGGNTSYRVKIPSPLTPYSTTGGNVVEVTTAQSSSLINVYFGYGSGGTLSLQMPPGVSFTGLSVSSEDQLSDTDVNPIKVTDFRLGSQGWTVTCNFSRDFELLSNPAQTLPIANRLSNRPQNFQNNGGEITSISLGNNTTVPATGNSFSMVQAGVGSGSGVTDIATNLEYNLPAFSLAGEFQTSLVCTVI